MWSKCPCTKGFGVNERDIEEPWDHLPTMAGDENDMHVVLRY